jgi:ketosteroid isomerase-like protein
MNTDNPVLQVLAAYQAAVHAQDLEAFVRLYHPQVQVFDAWDRWSYDGLPAWRAMVAGWFGSLGTERVAVRLEGVQARVSGDLAAGHAFVTYAAIAEDGRELRSLTNRMSLVLAREGGEWKIVHEHGSSPVDFGTKAALLQR